MQKFFLVFFVLFFAVTFSLSARVTFIIPCYNDQGSLSKTLDSIYKQDLKEDFEIICTDDASTDATYETLLQMLKTYPHLRIYRHAKKRGKGASCNTCVLHSTGDLIFRLDPGNLLEEHSVQKLISYLDKQEHEIICFAKRTFLDPTTSPITYQTKRGYFRLKDLLRTPDTPAWSGNYLFTRYSYDIVGGYPTGYEGLEAFAFAFLQLAKGFTIAYVPHTQLIEEKSPFLPEEELLLDQSFFSFLLDYEHLFAMPTIWLVEKELRQLENEGKPLHNYHWYLQEQKLKLR